MQALFPLQPVLVPQPGRSAGTHSQAGSANPPMGRSAGTHSQAGSAIPQPGRSAGSTDAHSQAGSANPLPRQAVLVLPARKKWVSLLPAAAAVIPADTSSFPEVTIALYLNISYTNLCHITCIYNVCM